MPRSKAAPRHVQSGADLSASITGTIGVEDFKDYLMRDLQAKHYLDNQLYKGLGAFNPTANPYVRAGDIRFPADTTKDQLWEWYQTGQRHALNRDWTRHTQNVAKRMVGQQTWDQGGPFVTDGEGRLRPHFQMDDDTMNDWIDEYMSVSKQYQLRQGMNMNNEPPAAIPDPVITDRRAPREVMMQPGLQ